MSVWDPCVLPESAIADAGLDPATENRYATADHERSCSWRGDWYSVSIVSRAAAFDSAFYDPEQYTNPEPVTVNGRRAVLLHWASGSEHFCDLALDAPQAVNGNGRTVGVILLEATTNEIGRRHALCAELTRLASPLVPHLPGR
ncbi:hypothetical protein Ntsu_17050 [Nocardia sp. IFM 10818]